MARIPARTIWMPGGRAATLRVAEPADAPAYESYERYMTQHNPFRVRGPGEGLRTEEETRLWIAQHLNHPCWLMLVAVPAAGTPQPAPPDPGAAPPLLGCLAFRVNDRQKTAHHGHFGVGVHADRRGSGLGTALVAALLDWAAANPGIVKICLGCLAGNTRALALYQRMGFREDGRFPAHFLMGPGRYMDDVQMSLFVKPGLAPPDRQTWPDCDPRRRR